MRAPFTWFGWLGFILIIGNMVLLPGKARGVPSPTEHYRYGAEIKLYNSHRQSEEAIRDLANDVYLSCFKVHRALFVVQDYWEEITRMFESKGGNFSVLYSNPAEYTRMLMNRYLACWSGSIKINFVGKCSNGRETVAYVLVTLGFVHSTINICDEYFDDSQSNRVRNFVHEFGRLEGIGDSPDFDMDNIYVWDSIIGNLSDDYHFSLLVEKHGEKNN